MNRKELVKQNLEKIKKLSSFQKFQFLWETIQNQVFVLQKPLPSIAPSQFHSISLASCLGKIDFHKTQFARNQPKSKFKKHQPSNNPKTFALKPPKIPLKVIKGLFYLELCKILNFANLQ